MLKAAIIRGSYLNWVEMLCYSPLSGDCELTAYTSKRCSTDVFKVPFSVKRLTCPDDWINMLPISPRRLVYMFFETVLGYSNHLLGLETDLIRAHLNVVQTLDNHIYFSRQVVRAAERGSFRVVVTQWNNIPFNITNSLFGRNIKQEVNQRADRFMAITERAASALEIEGVNPERIEVIPLGMDLNRFHERVDTAQVRRGLSIDEDAFVVLYVGRLVRTKGLLQLIYAARHLMTTQRLGKMHFVLAGDGPLAGQLRKIVAAYGLTKRFLFLGQVPYDDLPRLYAMADTFVLPSITSRFWQEQFGMVLVEAMASGLPVLTTISGSIPEVVGEAGFLIQPDDHLALADGLDRIMYDDSLRAELRARGIQRADEKFERQKVARQILTLWKNL